VRKSLTDEEEDEIVTQAAKIIHNRKLEQPAVLFLGTLTPFAWTGSQFGRAFIWPFLSIIGDELGELGDKVLLVFEKRKNVEKLIKLLEEMEEADLKLKRSSKKEVKKSWRDYLPF
jgi:hypothetical protein